MIQDERSAVEERQFREDGRRMGGEVVSEFAVLVGEGERRLAAVARKLAESVIHGGTDYDRSLQAEAREVLAALGPEGGR